MASRSIGSKYKKDGAQIIFFDNDTQNVIDMEENVSKCTSIHVDDETPYLGYADGEAYMNSYLIIDPETQDYDPDAYNFYADLTYNTLKPGEEELICNGITQDIYDRFLIPWITENKDNDKIAVFDWDRTISIVEGLMIPSNFPFNGIDEQNFAREMATYVLGKKDRMDFLTNMFKMLHDNDVKICILTNNSAAKITNGAQRDCFLKMIKLIDPDFEDDNLLCSHRRPSKSWVFNEEMDNLKGNLKKKKILGGKKKTRRRRRRHKKQKTRKN